MKKSSLSQPSSNKGTFHQDRGEQALAVFRIFLHVASVFVLWFILFLGLFLGYFTFPVLIIGILILVYALLDLGLLFRMHHQERARQLRQEFLRSQLNKNQ